MERPPDRSVKGTLLLARMKYVRSKGEDAVQKVLEQLPPEDVGVIRGMLLPSSWYPWDLVQRLEASIVAVFGHGNRAELFRDMGRAAATANLTGNGTQRVYLRPGDPHFVLKNSPHVYATSHSSGRRTYEQVGEHAAVLKTADCADRPNIEDCLTTVGWLTRAIELAGGRRVTVVEVQCRARGAACCEYRCEWLPPLASARLG
jgi:uncharacterized protein (TIGR02265 family)